MGNGVAGVVGGEDSTGREKDVLEMEVPRLASLLPGLARWSHLAVNTVPNELVDVRLVSFLFLRFFLRVLLLYLY